MEELTFDFSANGATIAEDETAPKRLTGQAQRVWECVKGGQWWTLADLSREAKGSEAAVSARLRDLRKPEWGGYTVEREHLGNGIWRYRVLVNEQVAS